jgi:hypothetical protein
MSNSCEAKEKPKSLKAYLKSKEFLKTAIAVVVGGVAGFAYYYFVGCASGSCGITSNPYASIAFGGFFGYFLINRPCSC